MKRWRSLWGIVVLTVMVVYITTIGTSSMAQQPRHIAAILKTLANPFWVAMQQGLLEEAIKQGIAVEILAVPTEQDVEAQLNLCETAILRKPAVLLVSPITSRNVLPCLKKAHEGRISIIDLDGNLPVDLKTGKVEDIPVSSQIASNNVQAGQIAADYMIKRLGGKGKVLAIEGISGNITGMQRVDGFVNRLKERAAGIRVVGRFAGDWDRLKAASITSDALTANPDLAGIYCANDTMALGAVEAVFAAGKGGKVVVIGTDGIKDARDSILKDRLSATVAQLPYLMGSMGVQTATKVMKKTSVPVRQDVPLLLLTKEVLKAGKDPLLKYIR